LGIYPFCFKVQTTIKEFILIGMATVLAHSALTILELHLDAGVCLGTMALTKNALLLKQNGIFC